MTAAPARVRMAAADRREQLLDVARDMVNERGFHAVTVEAVARRAGISRPIVYGHFGDLDALLEAMIERETARAMDQLRRVLPAPGASEDVRRLLAGTLHGYLEAVSRRPDTWRLMLSPPEGAPELLREQIARGRSDVLAVLASVVGPPAGRTPPASVDPELGARLLSAAADEMARLVLADPAAYTVDRLMRYARWVLDRL